MLVRLVCFLLLLLPATITAADDVFMFPEATSSVLPDPARFFSPDLLSSPLPTNSFFQNFVLNNGNQTEYIHPYLIKPDLSSLTISYPDQVSTSASTSQTFSPDLTISALNSPSPNNQNHVVSSFSHLSVTLDIQESLKFFLVRGSPYVTFKTMQSVSIQISTVDTIVSLITNRELTKFKLQLNNGQTWLFYASSPITLTYYTSSIISQEFSGVFRIAILSDPSPETESVLDRSSECYPVSGYTVLSEPSSIGYNWYKQCWGEKADLLMLATPLHVRLGFGLKVVDGFRYKSIDGDLVGVAGDSWVLKSNPVAVTWHSIKGVRSESYPQIIAALVKDVDGLDSSNISTTSSYFYGKLVARAARLAMIAEEIGYLDVIPRITTYLKATIEPWLDGTFQGNGFIYDKSWGGIITKQGSADSGADFGFGLYNDHHYHIGYFVYGIAVLAKIDPDWGIKYKPQAYSLMGDFMTFDNDMGDIMTFSNGTRSTYPYLRCFDTWKLHSEASGLIEFADGRNQESTSEAINAYYSAALMGSAYGDTQLFNMGSLLATMEIDAANTWWHIKENGTIYPQDFASENRITGIVWANKRDSGLWFAPPEQKECRVGIQVLPLLPVTGALFADRDFVRQLVDWSSPALERGGVGEGWKAFVYALEGIYDQEDALVKVTSLTSHDDGNSLSNMLWWIFSRYM
uniref:ascus wall endo-1,3(4)-beta-glucanase-like n=1 Tax=Erigeron canadensis TaxID=72917 RepID=UPI001CB9B23E|nr:ascus wall endo-1,3(4)-beta-glucanase-like [Erigeron canadensis]